MSTRFLASPGHSVRQPVYIRVASILSPPISRTASARLLQAPGEFQVLANRRADGRVPANRFVGGAPDQHELAGGADIAAGARLRLPQILQERQENEAARQNEPLGDTFQLLTRHQREQVEMPRQSGLQALESTCGDAVTSASMKHSHSLSGAAARAPMAQACDLPIQRGGSGGLLISASRGCVRAKPATMAAVRSAE